MLMNVQFPRIRGYFSQYLFLVRDTDIFLPFAGWSKT
jgi:hypothetical protein